jgi:hypothetical protein
MTARGKRKSPVVNPGFARNLASGQRRGVSSLRLVVVVVVMVVMVVMVVVMHHLVCPFGLIGQKSHDTKCGNSRRGVVLEPLVEELPAVGYGFVGFVHWEALKNG